MNELKLQILLFWLAVSFYVVATVLTLISSIFEKPGLLKRLPLLAAGGFVAQTTGLTVRWVQTGHFPYWGRYEVFNAYAWGAIALYLLIYRFKPDLRLISSVCFPVAFFATGIALTGSTETKEIPRNFLTYWLGVHVAFAKLAYGSGLISAFFATLYLLKSRRLEGDRQGNTFLRWIPSLEQVDYYVYRFAVFAFITMSIMIAAGAVWAFRAWGRYWGWDPVETWSLVSWFTYGILLHVRITLGWRGRRAAWLSILAVIVIAFSYFGMPLIYDTVHEHLAV